MYIHRVALCVLFSTIFLLANDSAYLNTNTIFYEDAKKQSVQGELIVASTVKILSKTTNLAEVEFIGYAPEESPIVYEKMGELKSGYIAQDLTKFKIIGKEIDEYDTEWLKISVKGYVDLTTLSENKQEVLKVGENLFAEKCSTCHALNHKEEFDISVWPSILENMAAQSGLTNIEKFTIEKYLQER